MESQSKLAHIQGRSNMVAIPKTLSVEFLANDFDDGAQGQYPDMACGMQTVPPPTVRQP
jgi:hypothetical protein